MLTTKLGVQNVMGARFALWAGIESQFPEAMRGTAPRGRSPPTGVPPPGVCCECKTPIASTEWREPIEAPSSAPMRMARGVGSDRREAVAHDGGEQVCSISARRGDCGCKSCSFGTPLEPQHQTDTQHACRVSAKNRRGTSHCNGQRFSARSCSEPCHHASNSWPRARADSHCWRYRGRTRAVSVPPGNPVVCP
jgi:hypothetical protein